MSQTLKVLRQVQESRQNHQDPRQDWLKTVLVITPNVCAIAAILISILAIVLIMTNLEPEQIKARILEKTIQLQERKIDDVITLSNKSKNNSDSQIRDLELRLRYATQNMKVQVNSLTLAFKDIYALMLSNRFNSVPPDQSIQSGH